MITIQRGVVVTLPDNVPVPPGAIVVEPPADFFKDRSAYRIEGDHLVRLTAEEIEQRRSRRPGPRLTEEDIRRLKEALDAGRI
jgi:hypothetical protein